MEFESSAHSANKVKSAFWAFTWQYLCERRVVDEQRVSRVG
jgi:hypothetical protein